jgi:hypothetical protein
MTPYTVCAKYAGENRVPTNKKVTVQILKADKGEMEDMVLIEGEATALEFLGKILIAQSQYKRDCSFFFGPHTAGNAFFTKISTHGIYIHRLPCLEKPGLKLAKP